MLPRRVDGVCTAQALARFYAALIGEVDTLTLATTEQAAGRDRVLRMPVRWSAGFALSAQDSPWLPPTTFGFSGLGGSLGFADPETGLAFGYVMNRITEAWHLTHEPRASSPRCATAADRSEGEQGCHQAPDHPRGSRRRPGRPRSRTPRIWRSCSARHETQGVSTAELARRTGVSPSDVLEFEAARVVPAGSQFTVYMRALGLIA